MRCDKHKKFGVDLCSGCLYEENQRLEKSNNELINATAELLNDFLRLVKKDELIKWLKNENNT